MITRQSLFEALFKLKNSGVNVDNQLQIMATKSGIPNEVIIFLRDNSPQFQFFRDIQKNQRALMKNILNYEELDTIGKIKVCSSLITRAAISVEYKNINETLLDELDLASLSTALNRAFKDRDYTKLDEALEKYKQSMLLFVKKKN